MTKETKLNPTYKPALYWKEVIEKLEDVKKSIPYLEDIVKKKGKREGA